MSIQITGGAGLQTTGGTLTGPLAIAVGSAAAPGLAVAGDSNTGLWAPAADTLAVSTAGVEAIRVTGAQFVGIGTTSPAAPLHVFHNSAVDGAYIIQAQGTAVSGGLKRFGNSIEVKAFRCTLNDIRIGSNYLALDPPDDGAIIQGNVGIGITAPTAALHLPVSSTARASLRIPAGTAPTIPNAGDVWVAGTVIKFFDGTTTKEIAFV